MSLHDLGFGHRFLVLTATTEKDKLAFLKLRTISCIKGHYQERENTDYIMG